MRGGTSLQAVRPAGVEPTYVGVWDTKEKGSDVSLASFMFVDGFKGLYDVAIALCDHMPVNPLICTEQSLAPLWVAKGRSIGPRSFEQRGFDLMRTVVASKNIELFGADGDTIRGWAENDLTRLGTEEKKGGCFVATAVYGVDAPQAEALRVFRDSRMMPSASGRLAIRLYYWLSPPLATWIRGTSVRQSFARQLFDPVVRLVRRSDLGEDRRRRP